MIMINPKYPPKKSLSEKFHGASFSLKELEKDGYIIIELGSHLYWSEVHKWCNENIGSDNYTWYGSNFVFDRKDFAEDFAIRWG